MDEGGEWTSTGSGGGDWVNVFNPPVELLEKYVVTRDRHLRECRWTRGVVGVHGPGQVPILDENGSVLHDPTGSSLEYTLNV
ncbi:MAG: hypothetical protein ACR2LJ_12555 [Acidimicrobiales bacterium]